MGGVAHLAGVGLGGLLHLGGLRLGALPQPRRLELGRGDETLGARAEGLVRLRGKLGDDLDEPPHLFLHLARQHRQPRRALPGGVALTGVLRQRTVDLLGSVTAAAYDSETVRRHR